jgi:hypothetical protein
LPVDQRAGRYAVRTLGAVAALAGQRAGEELVHDDAGGVDVAALVLGAPRRCSGDMYPGVPAASRPPARDAPSPSPSRSRSASSSRSAAARSLMKRHHRALKTYTLGTEYGDEYADAEDLTSFLGTSHARVHATPGEALTHFERAALCNETVDGLTAETLAQLSVLAEAASAGVRRIVTGYGADLLFGSMLRHELYMNVTAVDDLQSLIERTAWSGEFSPFYAWSLGVEVHHLFWDPRVMGCAFQIPAEASFDGTIEKVVLRTMAVARGRLQKEHAFREKKALTDGTQFNRLLSAALGLSHPYAYDEKSARSVAVLRRLFVTSDERDRPSDRQDRTSLLWTPST